MRPTRNDRPFYYCLFNNSDTESIDEYGNPTGEYPPIYDAPVLMYANISPATGTAQTEQFGNLENYDKVLVIHDMDCPITESTVLFIDKAPEYADGIIVGYKEADALLADPVPIIYKPPKYDYIVKRVAKSLHHISIAVRKVEVS